MCTHEPGIDFDEVQRHRVLARGQIERLFDVASLSLGVVTTANFPKIAAGRDFAAVPALKIFCVVEVVQQDCV